MRRQPFLCASYFKTTLYWGVCKMFVALLLSKSDYSLLLLKGSIIRIICAMVTESGPFIQTKCSRPCLALKNHEREALYH